MPETGMQWLIVVALAALAALFWAGVAATRGHPFGWTWLMGLLLSLVFTPFINLLALGVYARRQKPALTRPCAACSAGISAAAGACPKCGHPTGQGWRRARNGGAIVVGMLAMAVLAFGVAARFEPSARSFRISKYFSCLIFRIEK